MKRIPERLIQEIISRTDIVRVVGEYVRLERKGARWVGLCPFHAEKTPSFGVNEDKGFFYCFGCKKGGDAITFVKEIERCGYVEAVERLAEKAGVVLSYEGEDDPEERRAAERKDSLYELYERLAKTFQHLLVNDERGRPALEYARRRGLGEQVIQARRLGYAPPDRSWLYRFLRSKSYSDEFLADSGLFSRKYKDTAIFSDRLMFPIMDPRGRVIAFGGRVLSGDGPKYINSPETAIYKKHETLYGLDSAAQAMRSSGEAILCEGYMDTIAFHAAGMQNAVAPLGTAFTESQAALVKRFAHTALLSFDSDKAGIAATERAIGIAENAGLKAMAIVYADAKDPAEMLEKFGPQRLHRNALSIITADDFIMGNAVRVLGDGGSNAIGRAFEYLFPFISGLDSSIRRDSFLQAAAARLGAAPEAVAEDFSRFIRGEKPAPRLKEDGDVKPFVATVDAELAAAIIGAPAMYEAVRTSVGPSDFEEPWIKEAFVALEECYREGYASVTDIVGRIGDAGFRDFVLRKLSEGAYGANVERFVNDGVRRVIERGLERKKRRVTARILEYDEDRDGGEVSLNDLLFEKMHLDGELARIKEERHGRS